MLVVLIILVSVAWLYWLQSGSGAKRGTFSEAAQSTLHLKPGQQKPSAGKPEIAPERSIPRVVPSVAVP
ncbi:hypothetical protein GRAN_4879 [Granulicella sibirica]|uniref:Uncharacterized protein n=1 Tax=Granulicella sibirica TaxID=2479048 RepID=A0A4Q0SXA9_9BACT|nr:hypothetical protein GRAN_4879 [Granulicella sibirica]